MGEWKEHSIGEISHYINRGFSPKYVEKDGIVIINQKCIRGGRIDISIAKLTDANKTITPEKILQNGDILINSTGVGTAGRVGIYLRDSKATSDSHVTIVRINKKLADTLFVFYNLRQRENDIEGYAEGSTGQIELGRERVKTIEISLPPLPEQKAIAAVLSSLDDKIDLLRRQNKTLEAMAETLFREWFVEEARDDWDEAMLSDVCSVITKGTTPTTLGHQFVAAGVNFVKAESITDCGDFIVEKLAHISEETHNFLKRSIIQSGDVLCSIAGTIGRVAIVDASILPANTNQAIAILRVNHEKCQPEFVYLFLKSSAFREIMGGKIVHVVQPNLSLGEIRNTAFSLPPHDVLRKFEKVISPVFEKKRHNTLQIRILEKLRDTLLPKLMSGEVRVEYEH